MPHKFIFIILMIVKMLSETTLQIRQLLKSNFGGIEKKKNR